MTTVLHFADLHLGIETHGRVDPSTGFSTRYSDVLSRLDEIVDYALSSGIDLAIFAGDAFKNSRPSPTYLKDFASRIRRLSSEMPVLLLIGNHDIPRTLNRAASIDIFSALDVPNVIVGSQPGSRLIETKSGPVHLAWMPYPLRERLLTGERLQSRIEDLDTELRQMVHVILEDLRLKAEAWENAPRILAAHLAVAGADPGTDLPMFLGRDVYASLSDLTRTWDYVALGHYHRHQILNIDPPVVYSGSPERVSFGEGDDIKGFVVARVERGTAEIHFRPTKARPFVTYDIDLRPYSDPTQDLIDNLRKNDLGGVVLRLRLVLNAEQQASFSEIQVQRDLEERGVSYVLIIKDVRAQSRLRLEEESIATMSPQDLVRHYFATRGLEDARLEQHVQLASQIMSEVHHDSA